ncbi:Pectin methylesterase [Phytophthora cinnamomi]|uniref:Pectin methylesterase n=1 Tax=Phytophthora cinnamomi TaxID=4785 RepID=UPI00355A6DC6|nr:Pectin methylesterase [Phytophthora cinnamomi]
MGRPWKPYSRVVWQNSGFSKVINSEGWQKWNGDNNVANVYLKEFNNRGPGAARGKRVGFSGALTQAVPITDILGSNYKTEWWVDANFL